MHFVPVSCYHVRSCTRLAATLCGTVDCSFLHRGGRRGLRTVSDLSRVPPCGRLCQTRPVSARATWLAHGRRLSQVQRGKTNEGGLAQRHTGIDPDPCSHGYETPIYTQPSPISRAGTHTRRHTFIFRISLNLAVLKGYTLV